MRKTRSFFLGLLLATVAGCSDESAPDEPLPTADVVMLTPTQHLVRASMALRGMRPSAEDLARVDEDPSQLEAIVDGLVERES